MKKYILLILAFCMCSICFAQKRITKGNIQICYKTGLVDGIGGQDHCITIWFEDSLIFTQRICYSLFNNMHKYYIGADTNTDLSHYYEVRKQVILCHYQENNDFLILDEQIEISNAQFDEFIKVVNEIKAFVEVDANSDEKTISSGGINHYVIKDENGTVIIVDWLGCYDKSREIEKVLGLKSYLRCPCVAKDLTREAIFY